MNKDTKIWLHEGRLRLRDVEEKFSKASSLTTAQVENLVKSFEYGIKAPLVEKYGSVPGRFHNHCLTSLCQSVGFWSALPTDLQVSIQEIEPFYPIYPSEPAYTTLVSSSTPSQWKSRIEAAGKLLDFIETKVI